MPVPEIVLITGTRKGIGRHLAEHFVRKGALVEGCSRTAPDWELENYTHHLADVTSEADVRRMMTSIRRRHNRLDVLVNNTGIASMNHTVLMPLESAARIMNTNFLGTFLMCRESAKLMRQQRRGRIINLGSIAVPMRLAGESVYAASKSAITTFTQILAGELAGWGITCNVVSPAPVETDLIRSVPPEKIQQILDRLPISRLGRYEDVAHVVDFFAHSSSDAVTGQVIYLGSIMSLAWLFERMAQWRDASAVVWRDEHTTYGELLERVEGWRHVLDQAGVSPGTIVAVEGEFSPGTCTLLLALIDRSCIVVPITKAVAAHRNDFLRIAEVEQVAVFDDAGAWRFETRDVHPEHPMLRKLLDDGTPGLVLFSSGSTGESKAVLSDLDRLLEKFKASRQRLVTLTFLLFDHIGGFNTLFYVFSNGGTVVTVQSRSPEEICRLIELHKVELLPTTPTFLNLLLLSEAYRSHDLSSLKLITYGTEVMPDSTLQRLHEAFPNVRLQQTYGLTELGILRSKSQDSASAWVKVGGEGIETKVVDGTLWVKAPSAMAGYLNAPSPFDAEGWMNTEDLVEVNGEYVRFLGRKSQIINVGGAKVYPAEVESVLLQMPNVGDATVYGRPNPITGQIVAARLTLREPEELAALTRRVRAFCRDHLAAYKIPVKVELAETSQVSARFKKIRKL